MWDPWVITIVPRISTPGSFRGINNNKKVDGSNTVKCNLWAIIIVPLSKAPNPRLVQADWPSKTWWHYINEVALALKWLDLNGRCFACLQYFGLCSLFQTTIPFHQPWNSIHSLSLSSSRLSYKGTRGCWSLSQCLGCRLPLEMLEINNSVLSHQEKSLQSSLHHTQLQYSVQLKDMSRSVRGLESELGTVRDGLEIQKQNHSQLLNTKMRLEREIATYRKLLEHEEGR